MSPIIDLLLGCGGLMWLLILLQYCFRFIAFDASSSVPLAFALLGTHIFSDTHTAATVVKVASERARFGLLCPAVMMPLAIGVPTVLAGLCIPGSLPIMLRAYFAVIVHHYCRQAYGISVIYCHRFKYRFGWLTKSALSVYFDGLAVLAIVRSFSEPGLIPTSMLDQPVASWTALPPVVPSLVCLFSTTTLLVFIAMAVRDFGASRSLFPIPAIALLVTTTGLLLCPNGLSQDAWLFAPAFFHGSQYLLVILGEKRKSGGIGANRFSEYACSLLFLAMTLFFGLPLLLQRFGFNAAVATASVFCALSFHHVVSDALIWRGPKNVQ